LNMATKTFGQLPQFDPESETISAYIERADLFFAANDVPNEKKVSVFLTVIGGKTYTRLRSLLSPQLPQERHTRPWWKPSSSITSLNPS